MVTAATEPTEPIDLRVYPMPREHLRGPSEWEARYLEVMSDPALSVKARDLLAYMLEALGRSIPACLSCRDSQQIELGRHGGSFARCPDCRE